MWKPIYTQLHLVRFCQKYLWFSIESCQVNVVQGRKSCEDERPWDWSTVLTSVVTGDHPSPPVHHCSPLPLAPWSRCPTHPRFRRRASRRQGVEIHPLINLEFGHAFTTSEANRQQNSTHHILLPRFVLVWEQPHRTPLTHLPGRVVRLTYTIHELHSLAERQMASTKKVRTQESLPPQSFPSQNTPYLLSMSFVGKSTQPVQHYRPLSLTSHLALAFPAALTQWMSHQTR